MMPRLTIVLGAGGVGKTTLASALGLSIARAGGHVALLGVDPARRLRTSLGLTELAEQGSRIAIGAGGGSLSAAVLDPSACLRRWVGDALPDDAERARLLANPFFVALADRLAGFTDAIGCARAVEWAEHAPELTDIVLDTAPGTPAVELLARPEKLAAFFDGHVLRWLVRLGRFGGSAHRGGRVLATLGELSGQAALADFGALAASLDGAIATMVRRLERVRRWLRESATAIAIVCGVSDGAADAAIALDAAVRNLGFRPALIALNRVLPGSLTAWSPTTASREARAFVRYVHGHVELQGRVRARLVEHAARVIAIEDAAALDASERLDALAVLGEPLRDALRR